MFDFFFVSFSFQTCATRGGFWRHLKSSVGSTGSIRPSCERLFLPVKTKRPEVLLIDRETWWAVNHNSLLHAAMERRNLLSSVNSSVLANVCNKDKGWSLLLGNTTSCYGMSLSLTIVKLLLEWQSWLSRFSAVDQFDIYQGGPDKPGSLREVKDLICAPLKLPDNRQRACGSNKLSCSVSPLHTRCRKLFFAPQQD